MKKGNVQAALNLISSSNTSRVVNLDDKLKTGTSDVERTVQNILRDKHPASTQPSAEVLLPADHKIPNLIIFDS